MTPLDPKPVEDFGNNFSNLSSTLKKLFMWEKKLYQEVKVNQNAELYKPKKKLILFESPILLSFLVVVFRLKRNSAHLT